MDFKDCNKKDVGIELINFLFFMFGAAAFVAAIALVMAP